MSLGGMMGKGLTGGIFIYKNHQRRKRAESLLRKAVIESLETRTLLSSYVVNSLSDDGASGTSSGGVVSGELRWVIGQADAAGGNQTITFSPSLTASGSQTISLSRTALELNDTSGKLTIDGNGITIDANHSSNAFIVDSDTAAELDNFTITHGNSAVGGGIDDEGTLTIFSCSVLDNHASVAAGGIYVGGSASLTVLHSSLISGNTSDSWTGGIGNYGTAVVEDSTISGNTAVYGAGGLYSLQMLTLTGCTVVGNSAAFGGGLSNYGSAYIESTTFGSNDATNSSGVGGGAIQNHGTLTITGSTISGNQSAAGGGGISNEDYLTVSSSTISGNSTGTEGGGIYSTYMTIIENSSVISGNTSAGDGSGVYSTGKLVVADSIISGNEITGPGMGGGIYSNGSLAVSESKLIGNTGSSDGGALSFAGTAVVTKSTLSENSSTNGGGVYVEGGDLTIQASTISGNTATGETGQVSTGGGILNDGGNSSIYNSTISGNVAFYGGAIYNTGQLLVSGSTIADNDGQPGAGPRFGGAGGSLGAGIFNNDAATVDDSTISGNDSDGASGIYNELNLTLNGTIIATNSGGDMTQAGTASGSDNLIGDGIGIDTSAGDLRPTNGNISGLARLAPLGYYGGPTETMPPLPGSPALGAGIDIPTVAVDQRGVSRPSSAPDIGAVQSRGFVVTATGGTGTQTASLNSPFSPLTIHVSSNDPGLANLAGGVVTFIAPSNGPAAVLGAATAVLNSSDSATDTATANSIGGNYTITASASPGTGTAGIFSFTNQVTSPVSISGAASVSLGGAYTLYLSGPSSITAWTINWGDATSSPLVGFPASTSHTYAAVGTYLVTATANDSSGTVYPASGGTPMTVSVTAGASLQIVGPTYDPMNTPITLQAQGGNVSGTGSQLLYLWSVGETGATVDTGEGANFKFTPTSAGSYTVTLTAIGDPSGPSVVNHAVVVPPARSDNITITAPPDLEVGHLALFQMDQQQILTNFTADQIAFWKTDTGYEQAPTFLWSAQWSSGGTDYVSYYPNDGSTSQPGAGVFFINPDQAGPDYTFPTSNSFEFAAPTTGEYTISLEIDYLGATVLKTSIAVGAIQPSSINTVGEYFNDPTFQNGELFEDIGFGSIQESNGDIIVVSGQTAAQGGGNETNTAWSLTCLKPDLTIDTGFQNSGFLTQIGPSESTISISYVGTAPQIAECENGDFIVAACEPVTVPHDEPGHSDSQGFFDTAWVLARYFPNGALDTNFGIGGFAYDYDGHHLGALTSVSVEGNGEILLTGSGYVPDTAESNYDPSESEPGVDYDLNERSCFLVERWTDAGVLDTSFGHSNQSGVASSDFSASDQGGGRVFVEVDNDSHFYLKFHDSEEEDFTTLGSECAYSVIVQPTTGNIVVGGYTSTNFYSQWNFTEFAELQEPGPGTSYDADSPPLIGGFALIRLTKDGVLDTTFGSDGSDGRVITYFPTGFNEAYIDQLGVEPGGDIIAMGQAGVTAPPGEDELCDFAAVRYTADGVLESNFGQNGFALANYYGQQFAYGGAVTASGEIFICGETISGGLLAAFTSTGLPDDSLIPDGHVIVDGTPEEFSVEGEPTQPCDNFFSILLLDSSDVILTGTAGTGLGDETTVSVVRYHLSAISVGTLVATATPGGPIDLDWTSVGGKQDGFEILRATSPAGLDSASALLTAVGPDQTSYADTTVAPDTTYYYQIVAFGTSSTGAVDPGGQSNVADATTAPVDAGYVLLETLYVPDNGSAVMTNFSLGAGENYLITATGTVGIGEGKYADAYYGRYIPLPDAFSVLGAIIKYGIGINDPTPSLSLFPDWGPPSTDDSPAYLGTDEGHTYTISYTPNPADPVGTPGAPGILSFNFHDNYYPDNVSGETIEIQIYGALPSSPSNVTATGDRPNNQINLSWQNNAVGATGIVVQRATVNSDGSLSSYTTIATLPPGDTSYSDTSAAYNTSYSYELFAVGPTAQSEASNSAYGVLINLAPVIQPVPQLVAYLGSPFTFNVEASDPEDGKSGLVYSLLTYPSGAAIDQSGQVAWTPETTGNGTFKVKVQDAEGDYSTTSFVVLQAPAYNTLPQPTPPTITQQTPTTLALAEPAGPDGTTYQWVTLSQPQFAGVPIFSTNANATANDTTVTLDGAGAYVFEIILNNASGWPESSSNSITIGQVLTSIAVTPPLTEAAPGTAVNFSAKGLDQFGQPMSPQPSFNWAVVGGSTNGSITSVGVYSAPSSVSATVNAVINATVAGSSVVGIADVTVPSSSVQGPTIQIRPDVNPLSFTQLQLSVFASDPTEPESSLIYTWSWKWSDNYTPPAGTVAPVFNINGTNAAKNAIVTISSVALIDYEFDVTVTDQAGLQAKDNIELTDGRNFTSVALTPNRSEITTGSSITFTATALDQYLKPLSGQPSINWKLNGNSVSGDSGANYNYSFSSATAGQYTIFASATVGSITYSAVDNISVIAPGPATMFIGSPGDGYGKPATVITQDTPVDIVADNVDGAAVPWSLLLIGPNGYSTILASSSESVGQAPDSPAQAATIYASSLANGPYTLELEDGSHNVIDTKYVDIETQVKLGNLTLPFTDLTVDATGSSPLPITRTYDSSQASANNGLGYGWSLNVSQSPIVSTVSPQLDSAEYPGYTDGDLLYLTTPDGIQHTFEFLPEPTGDFEDNPLGGLIASVETYLPQFVCVDGSGATLKLMTGGDPISTDFTLIKTEGRYVDNSNTGDFFNPANPLFNMTYSLVTVDGTKYSIDPNSGKIDSATSPTGNVTNYQSQPYEIQNVMSGYGIGDIASITDTATGQEVQYAYYATGDLKSVTDAAGRITQFYYNTDHQLTKIVDANGVTVLQATYDPSTGLLASLINTLNKSSGVSTGGFNGTNSDQTTSDAAGDATEDIYDQYGDVTRKIQTIMDASGSITGYLVTISNYSYFNSQNIDAASSGVDLLNTPIGQATYAPFEVYGTDAAGLRYTQQPTTPPQQMISYFAWNGDTNSLNSPDLGKPESEMTLIGPASVSGDYLYNVTEFPEYLPDSTTYNYNTFGQAQLTQTYIATTDSGGNVLTSGGNPVEALLSATSSTYDSKSDLTSSTDVSGVQTSYTYTNASYGIDAGQVVETGRKSPGDTAATEVSYNSYCGTDLDGNQPPYVVAPSTGLTSDQANWQIGKLASSATFNYESWSANPITQTTYYVYDAQGNVLLTYTPKTWTANNGTSYSGFSVQETQYNMDGQSVATYQGTYLGTALSFSISALSGTTGQVVITNAVYDDATQSSGGSRLETGTTTYTPDGQTSTTTDQYGGITTNVYDASGHLVDTIYPDGTEVRSIYDVLGRVIWQTDRYATTTLSSGSTDNTTTANATQTVYNSLGQVSATYRMSGVLVMLGTDPNGNGDATLQESTLASSGTQISESQTIYNAQGQAIETISPSGLMTGTIYNPDGSVLNSGTIVFASTAPVGSLPFSGAVNVPTGDLGYLINYTTNAYDKLTGLPTSATSVGAISYSSVTDALGHITKTFTNAQGQTVETLYDDGSYSQTRYSVGDTAISGYTEPIPAGGSETVNINQHKSADTNVPYTIDVYDAAGNLVDVYEPPVADALNSGTMTVPHTHYDYDASGNEMKQADAKGNVTSWTYDANSNQLSRTLPDNSGTTPEKEYFTYNQYGQVATHTDFDGNVATYTYYSSYNPTTGAYTGSLQSVAYVAARGSGKINKTVSYTYDSLGRQWTVADASGTTTNSYDSQGNLNEQQTPEGTVWYVFNQSTGLLTETRTTYTDTVYGYNTLGQLQNVTAKELNGSMLTTPLVTSYTYDNAGNKSTETLPDGELTKNGYDDLNRLTSMNESQGTTTLFSETFILNSDGTRHSAVEQQLQTDGSVITLNYAWGYDADGRLKSESLSATGNTTASTTAAAAESYSDNYSYDLDGNQIQKVQTTSAGTETTTNTYNGDNELTQSVDSSTGTTIYGYDADGSQTSSTNGGNVTTDTYDVRNRLSSVTTGGVTTTYGYDDAGNRVSETTAGTTTYYLIDSNNPTGYAKPIEQWTSTTGNRSTATLSMSYVIGDRVLAQVNGSGVVSYLLIDGQENTRALTNSSGGVTATFDYSAFGSAVGSWSFATAPTDILFQQTMYDVPSGLNIFGDGVREAKPGEDSYIESDSGGHGDRQNPITQNLYLLDNANSVNIFDPSGHEGLAELSISETINQTLEAVQFVQKVIRVKNEVSSVLDFIQVIYDIAVSTADGGPLLGIFYGLLNKVPQDLEKVGRSALDPVNLFESIGRNATRIAATNVESPSKDFTIASAFTAPDSAVVLYVPGFLGNIAPKPTGLKVAGRPLDIASHQGFSFGGIGIFSAETGEVQFFHVDLVIPGFGEDLAGHTGPTKDDIDTWIDGDLNYQVPR